MSAYGVREAEAALDYCLRLGQQVYTPDTPGYPDLLREIYNPPAVLYVRGTLPDASGDVAIGVVGTRKAGKAGLRAAREISYELAQEGAAVISGGALGIDSEAHRGAIDGRGRTVAVLPCGLDYPYLMDNANLRREILDSGGALVTEYPMQTPVQRGAFQTRNRLISGMAHGVLVAEAPKKSGALITARGTPPSRTARSSSSSARIRRRSPAASALQRTARRASARRRISCARSRRSGKARGPRCCGQAAENVARPARRVRVVPLSDSAAETKTDAEKTPAAAQPEAGLSSECAGACWRRSAESRSTPPFWRRKPGFPQAAACSRR